MTAEQFAALRRLWQEAFDNPDAFLDAFFSDGIAADGYHCIWENNVPVSALYWFDCSLKGHRLAYIYGVATLKSHRGRGLARQLMAETHEILRKQGYSGAVLVPEEAHLFDFYRKLGYRTVSPVTEFSCSWGDSPVSVREIDADEYAHLRRKFLPDGGVVQEGKTLAFLQSYAHFYAGEDFLLVGEHLHDNLVSQELLGNSDAAPDILRTLNIPRGHFRTPGTDRDFAMFLPLEKNCPIPTYLGLALD